MRIAQIAPLYETVPPTLYGGTERIISYLTENLVELGHDVTLFAADGSRTGAHFIAGRDRAFWLDDRPLKSEIAAHVGMLHAVARRADEFDILHFHLSHYLHFPEFAGMAGRTVTTPHGRLDYVDLAGAYAQWGDFPMVSISDRQRRPLPDARWVATVQHGLPPDLYRPPESAGADDGYLVFLGRFSRDKRPDRAIDIARRSGRRLKMAAKLHADDEAFFRQAVEPALDGRSIEHVGEITDADKAAFLGGAVALLFPIDWPEPFGLVVIEAMACGTPVITWDNGAMSEIVDDGVTGFIVRSMDEAVEAVAAAEHLDRRRIRTVFERRFSARRMAMDYVSVYEQLIAEAASAGGPVARSG